MAFQDVNRDNVNTKRNRAGRTALHCAARDNDVAQLKYLLSLGANVNVRDKNGMTPLHLAAIENRKDKHYLTIRQLLNNSADVNARDKDGKTPVHYLMSHANFVISELVIYFMANLNIKGGYDDTTPLFVAITSGDPDVVQLLVDLGADVNSVNKFGSTPLHKAAGLCGYIPSRMKIVEIILKKGANVGAQDKDGKTPFHIVLSQNNCAIKMVQLFLDFKSDVGMKDKDGNIPMFYAIKRGLKSDVLSLLLDHGSDLDLINTDNFGHGATPMHWASTCNLRIIKYFLVRGENINALDSNGLTPLMRMLNFHKRTYWFLRPELKFLLKYSDFNQINSLPHDLSKYMWVMTVEHIAKLKALNIQVPPSILSTISNQKKYKNYFEKCSEELAKAKDIKIPDTWISFFDLLVASKRKLKNYAGNEDLVGNFKKSKCTESFPIFGGSMKENMKKGIERRKAFDESAGILSDNLPVFGPTHLVVRDILDCLTLKDYKKLIQEILEKRKRAHV